ncbi:DUF6301 family protein [Actinoplanes sp. CA-252034]|uniref:DUF6301 family protein n=1 Tax=Actinoplanes sp. CA-252034 TaxID=3239906 RepID=UPI003D98FF5D
MHVVARTVAAVAGIEWAWAADQLEELVTAAGWIYRQPFEGTVSCTFDAAPGRAGAFLFGAEVTAVYLNLHESDGLGVPARRDLFVAAVSEISAQLGPPPMRCPGPDPSVGWWVAAGVLEIVDRAAVLDLWLRPAPRRVPPPTIPAADRRVNRAAPRTDHAADRPVDRAAPETDRATDGRVDWAGLEEGFAAAVASLVAGTTVRLESTAEQAPGDATGTLVELRQAEDCLTVRVGDGTETIQWPAAGQAYRTIAGNLVAVLRERAGDPADLVYRSALPVPHLPLRRA